MTMTQVDQNGRTVRRVPKAAAATAPNQQVLVVPSATEMRPQMRSEQTCLLCALASIVAEMVQQHRRIA